MIAQAVALEAERAHDRRIDRCRVRQRRAPETRVRSRPSARSRRRGRCARGPAPSAPTWASKRRGHQTVHAAADDEDIASCDDQRFRASRITKRRVASRCAHDAAAGMRRRAAHPRGSGSASCTAPSPGTGRSEEQLLERQLALEDVALRQPEVALEVERRQHLPVQDDVADVRRVLARSCRSPCRRTPRAASSQRARRQLYGAYCTKHDRMCLPGGATDGSVSVGITMSMYGRRENSPYFAWS